MSTILSTLDTVYNLDWFSSAAKNECVGAVGFKWMLNQVRNVFCLRLLYFCNYKFTIQDIAPCVYIFFVFPQWLFAFYVWDYKVGIRYLDVTYANVTCETPYLFVKTTIFT